VTILLTICALVTTWASVAGWWVLYDLRRRFARQEETMLSLKEALAQINDATNSQAESLENIAADVRGLKGKIVDPADQAEAERLANALTAQAEFSKTLAASTADPVPTEPPTTEPNA
jgi:hypothetical protein